MDFSDIYFGLGVFSLVAASFLNKFKTSYFNFSMIFYYTVAKTLRPAPILSAIVGFSTIVMNHRLLYQYFHAIHSSTGLLQQEAVCTNYLGHH